MSVHTRTRRTSHKTERKNPEDRTVPWRIALKGRLNKRSEPGIVLKGYRNRNGLTQDNLADVLDINQHHISEMENNKRPIGKKMAQKLAKFFHTDYRVFL